MLPGAENDDGVGEEVNVRGALRREEWEGAMDAWNRVEQRLGR